MITTLLATIATEGPQTDDAEGAGSRSLTMLRPVNRPLRNDGVWRHWLADGHAYQLRHDGTGWHVTSEHWTEREGAHTYRLAEPLDGRLMGDLPTTEGHDLILEVGQTYELRQTQPGGSWALFTD